MDHFRVRDPSAGISDFQSNIPAAEPVFDYRSDMEIDGDEHCVSNINDSSYIRLKKFDPSRPAHYWNIQKIN